MNQVILRKHMALALSLYGFTFSRVAHDWRGEWFFYRVEINDVEHWAVLKEQDDGESVSIG